MKKTSIEFQAHPPERRRRTTGQVCCCGCSCCCCCLHTLGSLVGASIIAARSPKPTAANPQIVTHLGTGIYYKSLAVLVVLIGIGCSHEISMLLLVLLLCMPLVQLAASLISVIVLAFSKSPEKSAALKQVWAITAWTVAGGLIGIGVMVAGIGLLK